MSWHLSFAKRSTNRTSPNSTASRRLLSPSSATGPPAESSWHSSRIPPASNPWRRECHPLSKGPSWLDETLQFSFQNAVESLCKLCWADACLCKATVWSVRRSENRKCKYQKKNNLMDLPSARHFLARG